MIFFITVLVGCIGGFFTAITPLTPTHSIISSFFIVVFALPTYISFIQSVGKKKGVLILLILSLFALVIESCGIITGFPYGKFVYGNSMGWKIAGIVPWTVPFAYVPLVIGSYAWVHNKNKNRILRIFSGALVLVAIDLVLDPGAFSLKMWIWLEKGFFYGVPLLNFIGWFFSSNIALIIVEMIHKYQNKMLFHANIYTSVILTLSFWTMVAFVKQLHIPFILGMFLLICIAQKILRKT